MLSMEVRTVPSKRGRMRIIQALIWMEYYLRKIERPWKIGANRMEMHKLDRG